MLCTTKRAGEFKRAGDVGDLEETVFRGLDFRNELRAGGEDGECFLEKGGQVVLTVVIVDLQLVEGGELVRTIHEESDDLLKQRIMEALFVADEVLVDLEAGIGDVGIVQEKKHPAEDAAAFLTSHLGVFCFAANQWTSMNAMMAVQPDGGKGVFESFDFVRDVDGLVVEDHQIM